MPRRLTDRPNELRVHDHISGSEIVLYYRLPTTAERAAYMNEMFRREGRKVRVAIGETRLRHGLAILCGVREGDFEADDGRPLASDPASAHFMADWKERIGRHAGDLVELLACRVFESSATVEDARDDDGEDAEKN